MKHLKKRLEISFIFFLLCMRLTAWRLSRLQPQLLLIVGVVILINAFTNAKMNRIRYQIDGELWPLDRSIV